MRRIRPIAAWIGMLPILVALPTRAVETAAEQPQADAAASRFLRVARDDRGEPLRLETAIVRYRSAEGAEREVEVDLVGVVHVADRGYFEALNRRFRDYDAVLYELVAPEDARPRPGQRSGHPVSAMQSGLKNLLDLDYQLDHIDYHRPNFVHADLTPEEFAASMKDRDESLLKMLFRMMGAAMAEQSKDPSGSSDLALLAALFAKDRPLRLKRIMAQQFEDLEGAMKAFEPEGGSTIITVRNQRAMEVLERQLEAGKRRVAIFYGAGHLPDMDKRLVEDFGLKRVGEDWLSAWKLTP